MKYYSYVDYDETGGNITVVTSINLAIKLQIQYAESIGDAYVSTEQALNDYIAVNWAYESDKYGVRTRENL